MSRSVGDPQGYGSMKGIISPLKCFVLAVVFAAGAIHELLSGAPAVLRP